MEQAANSALDRRRAGVLLHITSLPGDGPCGTLGIDARRFVDWMAEAGLSVWQMLPVGPTQPDFSPYQSPSAHAGNPRLIALPGLVESGWLNEGQAVVDDDTAHAQALQQAGSAFVAAGGPDTPAFQEFCRTNGYWLDDYALFEALRHHHRGGWWDWPAPLRDRDADALGTAKQQLSAEVAQRRFEQFVFFSQWRALKQYANSRGVLLFGDAPIFVAHDSAEVWANPRDFLLDETGHAKVVAGVPPDYFSATGQRWGNPLYDWDALAGDDYRFWIDRLKTQLELYDLLRIDHFRGFEAYWEIPADEPTAIHGRWVKGHGDWLFERLNQVFGPLPLVAEDLGIITPEVEQLRDRFGLPGMKILQFAFDGSPDNPYLPACHVPNAVVYTGTHDNDTTLGWWQSLDQPARDRVKAVIGDWQTPMPWPLIRTAFNSPACLAVVPMQDFLALDGRHRMNTPGTTAGNWRWRFSWADLPGGLADDVRNLAQAAGRDVQTAAA